MNEAKEIGAVVTAGIGFRANPDQPVGASTSFSYAKIKGRVRTRLEISGVQLNGRELSMGTYWLANRIANMIGDQDKDIVVEGYIDRYVSQYLRDKDVASITGKPLERGPVHSRKWWETYYDPANLEQELEGRRRRREGPADAPETAAARGVLRMAEEKGEQVYVGIDGDDIGGLVERTLVTDDPEAAREISLAIHSAHRRVRQLVKDVGGQIIFDGGDNMLMSMGLDLQTVEEFRRIYKEETGHTATVGVGRRPVEAHYALVVGKNTGKDKVVVYSPEVAEALAEIRRRQDEIEPLSKALKYRASAGQDVEAGQKIKGAMWELQMDVTEAKVYDLLLRLVERFGLDEVGELSDFFDQDRESLKAAIRQVYAKRLDWSVRRASRDLTEHEKQGLLTALVAIVEALSVTRQRVARLAALVVRWDPSLSAAADGLILEGERLVASALAVGREIESGRVAESRHAHELSGKAAEATALAAKIDAGVLASFRALDNAQTAHLEEPAGRPIDTTPLIGDIQALTEVAGHAAMLAEMVLVVTRAECAVVQAGHGQKSPHAPKDWLTLEERNEGKVDHRKTDLQYVPGNLTPGSEVSFGGDPGQAVYAP